MNQVLAVPWRYEMALRTVTLSFQACVPLRLSTCPMKSSALRPMPLAASARPWKAGAEMMMPPTLAAMAYEWDLRKLH